MNKQDRNTAVTIALVLIVCTITLVAVGSFLVQLITPVFGVAGQVLGLQINSATANYNFAVDYDFQTVEVIGNDTVAEDNDNGFDDEKTDIIVGDSGINYNFPLPAKN